MKCAIDLCIIAAENATKNAAAEEARRQQEKRERYERTVAFCECIGAELERLAGKGEKPEYIFHVDWHGRELKGTHNDYCDKRLSYNPVSESMDISVLTEWFRPYCFTVTAKDFKYYWHGMGLNIGQEITIKPDPDCFKK